MTPHGDHSEQHDPTSSRSQPGTGWTLSTTHADDDYAPTFLGNGYFGGRIPAAGTGYATEPIEAGAYLAGFYARHGPVEQYASIPTWSTLAFSDGSGTYGRLPQPAPESEQDDGEQGSVSNYRQALDLRAGLLTTHATRT